VKALNDAGIETIASCCGHGKRPGNIVLKDGRELIIAPDFEAGRMIDRAFPPTAEDETMNGESESATHEGAEYGLPSLATMRKAAQPIVNALNEQHWQDELGQEYEVIVPEIARADALAFVKAFTPEEQDSE
jgi:hypothetical protein